MGSLSQGTLFILVYTQEDELVAITEMLAVDPDAWDATWESVSLFTHVFCAAFVVGRLFHMLQDDLLCLTWLARTLPEFNRVGL